MEESTALYDVIIIDLPDPSDIQLGKLYSKAFYDLVQRRLGPREVDQVDESGIEHVKPFGPSCIPSKPHRRVRRILKRSRSTRIHDGTVLRHLGIYLASRYPVDVNALKSKPEARFLNDQILPGLFDFPSDMARIEAPVSSLNDPVVVTLYRDGYHQYFD